MAGEGAIISKYVIATSTTVTSASTINTGFEPFDGNNFYIRIKGTINNFTSSAEQVLLSLYDGTVDSYRGIQLMTTSTTDLTLRYFTRVSSTLILRSVNFNYPNFDVTLWCIGDGKVYYSYEKTDGTTATGKISFRGANQAKVIIGGSGLTDMTITYFVADKDVDEYIGTA